MIEACLPPSLIAAAATADQEHTERVRQQFAAVSQVFLAGFPRLLRRQRRLSVLSLSVNAPRGGHSLQHFTSGRSGRSSKQSRASRGRWRDWEANLSRQRSCTCVMERCRVTGLNNFGTLMDQLNLLQRSPLTVTPMGLGKSVTVSICHSNHI